MVPKPAPETSAHVSSSLPPLTRSTTLPANVRSAATDRSLLAPEDAFYQGSPPRKQSAAGDRLQKDLRTANGTSGDQARLPSRGRRRKERRNRSGSRRRKGTWKKLLWVKQSCGFSRVYASSNSLMCEQIQTITRIKILFSNTYKETPACSRTISGR